MAKFKFNVESNNEKDKDLKSSKLEITLNEIKQLKATIASLHETKQVSDERVVSLTRKLERSVKTNRVLVDRASELDEQLSEAHQSLLKAKREYEAIESHLKSQQGSVDDYERSNIINKAL